MTWISPVDGQGGIELDTVVRASFTKDMDPATLAAAFTLSAGGAQVAGTVSYNSGSRTAFFTPSAPLASFAPYVASVSAAAKDLQGNPITQPYGWTFLTGGAFSATYLWLATGGADVTRVASPLRLSGSVPVDRSFTWGGSTGALWYDSASDRLFVANWPSSVGVFGAASMATGTVTPTRSVAGALTGISGPQAVWLDTVRDRLYVANFLGSSVEVFNGASTVNGNVAPARTLAGAATALTAPSSLWLDVLADHLYVSNYNTNCILVFANASATATTGNVAPARTLAGIATTLNGPLGVFLDKSADRLYVANENGGNVLVFDGASTATGNVAPARTIGVGIAPTWVWLDQETDRLYVGGIPSVKVLAGGSTLNGTPTTGQTLASFSTPAGTVAGAWLVKGN